MQAELLTLILGVTNEVLRLIDRCLTSLSTGYRVKLLVQLPLFTMPEPLLSLEEENRSEGVRNFALGVGRSENDSSPTHKGRPYICKVCRIELSSKQSLASHLNKHKAERAPSVTAQFGGRAATSSFSRTVEESGVIGGSTTGDNVAGNSHHQTISFQLQSKDLPSRRLLGKGLAGYGYETTWKGERFVRKDFIGVPRRIFEKEVTVLTGLENHKNIVKTYGWTADKRSCSLVLEYMENDLLSLLEKRNEIEQDLADIGAGCRSSAPTIKGPFDLPQAVDIMLQIAAGMKALHEQRIAHGDLKTKNILVTSVNNIDQNLMTVKVTDFGLVRSKNESKFIVSRQVQKLDMIQWKAPEYFIVRFKELNNLSNDRDGIIFSESGSSSESETESEASATSLVVNMRLPGVDVFAADVYSFGLICSHVLTGNDPYPNLSWKELGFKILSGLRPNSLPTACHPLLRDLLESCWDDDPTQRPTFSTIHLRLKDIHASVFLTSACAARRIQKGFRSHNEKKRQLAANRIQQKFRSWKVRKDFLNLRQQVVRIQAYMRGERVRRGLRRLRWSVSVLEKSWQRKVSGLQGFKNGDVRINTKEEDEEFLKSGRREAESKALEKATVGRFEGKSFDSLDLGGCKLEMQQKTIPIFSLKTDHIMSRYRPIAPKPKSKTEGTDKISSKPMPKTEGIGQTDSHLTQSSLSTSPQTLFGSDINSMSFKAWSSEKQSIKSSSFNNPENSNTTSSLTTNVNNAQSTPFEQLQSHSADSDLLGSSPEYLWFPQNTGTAMLMTGLALHCNDGPSPKKQTVKNKEKLKLNKRREPRYTIQTRSEVVVLEDGYKWRKYGQKAVKNSPHPRNYYRCTNQNCPVTKLVERALDDHGLVSTTYVGTHNHLSPASAAANASSRAAENSSSARPSEDHRSSAANFLFQPIPERSQFDLTMQLQEKNIEARQDSATATTTSTTNQLVLSVESDKLIRTKGSEIS